MVMSNDLTKTQQIAILLSKMDLNIVKSLSLFLSDNELNQISEAVKGVPFLNHDQIQETLEKIFTQLSQIETQGNKNQFSSYTA